MTSAMSSPTPARVPPTWWRRFRRERSPSDGISIRRQPKPETRELRDFLKLASLQAQAVKEGGDPSEVMRLIGTPVKIIKPDTIAKIFEKDHERLS